MEVSGVLREIERHRDVNIRYCQRNQHFKKIFDCVKGEVCLIEEFSVFERSEEGICNMIFVIFGYKMLS